MSGATIFGPDGDRTPARGAGPRRRGVGPGAILASLALAAFTGGCAGGGTPTERWYVDANDRVYSVVLLVIHDLGGEVVAETPWPRAVTARFPEEVFGHGVYLDVTIERSNDESWVRADVRPESAAVAKDDLELLRRRFFDELDAEVAQTSGAPVGHRPSATPAMPPR